MNWRDARVWISRIPVDTIPQAHGLRSAIKYEWLAAGTLVLHPRGGAASTPFARENSVLTRKIIEGIMRAMDRTIQLELQPTSEQGEALHETLQQFTATYNFVCADVLAGASGQKGDAHHSVLAPDQKSLAQPNRAKVGPRQASRCRACSTFDGE